MRTLKLSTVAAVPALGTVICFVAGAVAMSSSGVRARRPICRNGPARVREPIHPRHLANLEKPRAPRV
jgi:hypothetical protein